jgi:serine/threonine-protein kinase HipA
MTSEIGSKYSEAYVWVWLPTATEPVVAGLLSQQGQQLVFNYGRSYLARNNAIALYAPAEVCAPITRVD